MATLAELRQVAIAKAAAITDTDAQVNINEVLADAFINEGYHTIERAPLPPGILWKWSEAEQDLQSIADQRTLDSVPAAMLIPLELYDMDDFFELKFIDERQRSFYAMDRDGSSTATPDCWSWWSGELRLWPMPSATRDYRLKFYCAWDDLTADADMPVLPTMWHSLLSDYAAARLVEISGSSRAVTPLRDSFDRGLIQMVGSPWMQTTLAEVPHHHIAEEFFVASDR